MYSPLTYPETLVGGSYTRPALPSTFVSLAYSPNTWNPFSTNAQDRTEYWVDTAGTLTQDEAMTLCYGASGVLMIDANNLLKGGLTVTSKSASGIDGTYSTSPAAQTSFTGMQLYINTYNVFPGSSGTLSWPDINGVQHIFTSPTQFTNLAQAMATFVLECSVIGQTGQGVLPSNSVTIA